VRALRRRQRLTFSGLDLVMLAFCLGGVLIPWAVISLRHADAGLDEWRAVLAPLQYLLVYLVFSRIALSEPDLRRLLHLTMLASVIVALVALAEVANLPGVRQGISSYFPPTGVVPGSATFRPTSLLGHYSAVGAFAVLNLILALALAAARPARFNGVWLAAVLALNAVVVLASQTQAPIVALPLAAVLIFVHLRRVPRQVWLAPLALIAAGVALWPSLQARLQEQLGFGTPAAGGGRLLPESLQVRIGYWQDFFIPSLFKNGPWLGTGTLIPSEVPRPIVAFVDNGYLWMAFRAGIVGIVLMLALLVTIAAVGWGLRRAPQPMQRALGAAVLASVVSIALMELTSEYLTFTSVSQEFWMLVGLGAAAAAQSRPSPMPFLVLKGGARRRGGRRQPA
jgi:O-antigen ligase